MKVFMITNRLVIGGITNFLIPYIQSLQSEYEVILITGGKDTGEEEALHLLNSLSHVNIERIPHMVRSIGILGEVAAYKHIKHLIKKYQPAIIHTHGAKPGFLGRLAAYNTQVPVIIHTFHGHVFHSYFNVFFSKVIVKIEQFLAARSTAIIAVSDKQKEELSNIYHICEPDKIEVIPVGVEISKFQGKQDERRQKFREKYTLKDDHIAIGIIGRLVPIKNIPFFINVVERILQRNPQLEEQLKFFIIGDGELLPFLKELLEAKKIAYSYFPDTTTTQTVTFTSWLKDMEEVYAGLDVVTLTSKNEGNPLVLIEAQAANRPVVALNVGAISESIADGESGFLIPPGDLENFVNALEKLILYKEVRIRMGAKGYSNVVEKYSVEKVNNALKALYKRLLSGKKGANTLTCSY